MPKIADALERESRSVDLVQGDFERLLDRRERKQRNRRIRAGAVGVIVALVTAAFLARSIDVGARAGDPAQAARGRRGAHRERKPARAGSQQWRSAHDLGYVDAPRQRRGPSPAPHGHPITIGSRSDEATDPAAASLWVADPSAARRDGSPR